VTRRKPPTVATADRRASDGMFTKSVDTVDRSTGKNSAAATSANAEVENSSL
jgi:hypothetical protein